MNKQSIKDQEMSPNGFSIGFMRPIPSFIEISPFELNWLSPGIITDVHWDNTADIEKKLSKCKGYIKKGLEVISLKMKLQKLTAACKINPMPFSTLTSPLKIWFS